MDYKSAFIIPVIADWLPRDTEGDSDLVHISRRVGSETIMEPGVLFLARRDAVKNYPPGSFDLPGGTVDSSDFGPDGQIDPRITAIREFREEVGFTPDVSRMYPFSFWPKYGVCHFIYFMERRELGQIRLDTSEHTSCSILTESQLHHHLMPDSNGISEVIAIHGDATMFFLTHGNWPGRDSDLDTELKLWWDPDLLNPDSQPNSELRTEVRFDRELGYK